MTLEMVEILGNRYLFYFKDYRSHPVEIYEQLTAIMNDWADDIDDE